MARAILAGLLWLAVVVPLRGQGAPALQVANPSFEEGVEARPTGWTLEGAGAWGSGGGAEGQRFLRVENGGTWRGAPVAFAPGGVYELRLRCRYRPGAKPGPAFAVVGPEFAFRVIPLAVAAGTPAWTDLAVRFAAPTQADPETTRIRLGQWQLDGAIDYDALDLRPVRLAQRTTQGMVLGEGERISGNEYRFRAPLESPLWRNISRPLAGWNDDFHDNRWRFTKADGFVLYRFAVQGRRQTQATVEVDTWFHEESSWRLAVEASTDGQTYRTLGHHTWQQPRAPLAVPADLLPAETLWIRLRADASAPAKPVFFQCRGVSYTAVLDGPPCRAAGASALVTVLGEDEGVAVEPELGEEGSTRFVVRVSNRRAGTVALAPTLVVRQGEGGVRDVRNDASTVAAGASTLVSIPYRVPLPGRYELEFSLGGSLKTRLGTAVSIPILQASGYGERLASPDPEVAVWWASSGWKVSRTRPAPETPGTAVALSLARDESEAAQIVVRPDRALKGLTARLAGALKSAAGDTLPVSAVEVLRVHYVTAEYASDELGGTGEWPDPLPPFAGGIEVAAGTNQPLWVCVRAPRDARAGVYQGSIAVRADGFAVDVPLGVEVYDITLPETSTCRSLFGFSADNVLRYHNLKTESDRRTVLDKYLRSFSEHRISPYNPAPLDGFSYRWQTGLHWEGGRVVTAAHRGASALLSADADLTGNTWAAYEDALPVSGPPLKLSLWYRTERPDQAAYIYLSHQDAAGQHIANCDLHLELPPSTAWRAFERTIAEFPAGAVSFRLLVQGCAWSEKGERTGQVWIDDISLLDPATGKELLQDGGFEAARPAGAAPEVVFDWTAWDEAMTRAFAEYHFNAFVFGVPGLGGGTFQARTLGSLQGFAQGTPEHLARFQAWCAAARAHLAGRGWLDRAVVYPFDEPAERDYPFVLDQLRLLQAHFPGLHRMVPMNLGAADVFIGALDAWCPIMDSHRREFAAARQQAGDRYTWYICCGPKAPYVANFIDRAATDLRVWLWQTWQEQVDGILIWEAIYWNSPSAYPNALQNPYTDSMSWVSGYDTKPGEKQRWNVGDGRFLYPPEAAADGTQAQAVLEGPVSSIRWEALRDGVEDVEYLALLKRLLAERRAGLAAAEVARYDALLSVPPSISASLTQFTTDPAPIAARREEIARAIERLSGAHSP
jgi:hypothetical protein